MENYSLKVNLLKLRKAGIVKIKGRDESLDCVVLPIKYNHIFMSRDEDTNKIKSAYLDLTAWAMNNPKYDETHLLKQSLPKEVREQMNDEEKNGLPILGGMKPINIDRMNGGVISNAPLLDIENNDDLPF